MMIVDLKKIKKKRCDVNRCIAINYSGTALFDDEVEDWKVVKHEQQILYGDCLSLSQFKEMEGSPSKFFQFSVYDKVLNGEYTKNFKKTLKVWYNSDSRYMYAILYNEMTSSEIRKEKINSIVNSEE